MDAKQKIEKQFIKQKDITIDNDNVLSTFYEDRKTLVVDFNPDLVDAKLYNGKVIFKIKKAIP